MIDVTTCYLTAKDGLSHTIEYPKYENGESIGEVNKRKRNAIQGQVKILIQAAKEER